MLMTLGPLASNDCRLPWKSQTEETQWNAYIGQLGDTVLHSLQTGAAAASEHNAAYSRLGSELLAELHSHVTNCRRRLRSIGLSQSLEVQPSTVLHIQRLICADSGLSTTSSTMAATASRHPPIVVVGAQGSGKSTVLSQVFVHCADWLPTGTLSFICALFWSGYRFIFFFFVSNSIFRFVSLFAFTLQFRQISEIAFNIHEPIDRA